jgi:very-short-patch-repair endonuclease
MSKASLVVVDDIWPDENTESVPRKLPGLYPWVRFERCTREQWVNWYGLDLQFIEERAATTYLEGEAAFFAAFEEDCAGVFGKQHTGAAKQRTLEKIRSQFTHAAAKLCKSPIERLLLAALVWTKYGYETGLVEISTMPSANTKVVILPQYQIGMRQVDFAIIISGVAKEEIRIVVECDGHDWHEKTKEQAAHDKNRNRDLTIAGWKLLPFTGSEIWRNPQRCAGEVGTLATNEIQAQLRRRGYQISA